VTPPVEPGDQALIRLSGLEDDAEGEELEVLWETRQDSEILREYAVTLGGRWPGPRRPHLYYDPRSLDADYSKRATWNAKVVVADEGTSFVTSANFTEWAQQRNVEVGVLIRNHAFGRQLRQQFEALVLSPVVLEVPGFRS
jgi:phosphatidylserine/phosphatidylglycerophosphate/cardiolipin synthase-like enzyme